MDFIKENILLIICILLILIVIEGLIIYVQQKRLSNKKGSGKSDSSNSVSKGKHKKILKDKEDLISKVKQLEANYNKEQATRIDAERKYGDTCVQNAELKHTITELNQTIERLKGDKTSLEQQVGDLRRDNDELEKLNGIEPTPKGAEDTARELELKDDSANDVPSQSSQSPAQEIASSEVVQKPNEKSKDEPKSDSAIEPKLESPKEMTKYASFPRSADSSIYFSDLSENRADDSYFELKVDIVSGKASFKPIDFMKIRNYDPAMIAMLTEGVKPNVASTVLGIEPGKAHKEGKDWIIDNPAKIKLA